jgi:hypothetical protein
MICRGRLGRFMVGVLVAFKLAQAAVTAWFTGEYRNAIVHATNFGFVWRALQTEATGRMPA